jgi:chromosome segregation ATPase
MLGDESMKYFASTVLEKAKPEEEAQSTSDRKRFSYVDTIKAIEKTRVNKVKLESFDFSSSKIYDQGLIYLLDKLKDNTTLTTIKLKDNYFTHEVDLLVLEYLEPNRTITTFNVEKNRLSLLCMKKIHEIIDRNIKIQTNKEPNRLLVEVYRLRYENTKLDEMKDALRYLENNVEKLKLNKNDIRQEFETYKRVCDEEYDQVHKRLIKNKQNLDKSKKDMESLKKEIETTKEYNRIQVLECEKRKQELLDKKQSLINTIKEMKKDFNRRETEFIVKYDTLRTESQENQEKIKFYNNTNKLFQDIKEAEKKIKHMKAQGILPNN